MIAAASSDGRCSCAEKDVGLVTGEVSTCYQHTLQMNNGQLGSWNLPAVIVLEGSVGDGCELERSFAATSVVVVSSLGTCASSALIWAVLGLCEATGSLSHPVA